MGLKNKAGTEVKELPLLCYEPLLRFYIKEKSGDSASGT
jgi:hypothetical protein